MLVALLLFALFLAFNGRLASYGTFATTAPPGPQPAGSNTNIFRSIINPIPTQPPSQAPASPSGILPGTQPSTNPNSIFLPQNMPSWAPGAYPTWDDWFNHILGGGQ
jgi:hypothetical protein